MGDVAPLTPAQALQQAMQGESSPDFQNASWISAATQNVANGRFDTTYPGYVQTCGTPAAPNLNVFSTASGLAIGAAGVGTGIAAATGAIAAGTAAVLGAATMGAGLVVAVVGMIFAHHSAAVKQEQQLFCAATAAANNAIAVLDQAMVSGQTTVAAASAGLDTLVSQFSTYVSPSVKHNPCNANCEEIVQLKAMVAYRQYMYQAVEAASKASAALPATSSGGSVVPAAQTVPGGGGTLVPMNTGSGASQATTGTQVDLTTGAVVQPASTTGTPSWLPIAAAMALAFVVLR